MQNVVALMDDLITKFCDIWQKEKTSDHMMILSSDKSNEPRLQKKTLENKNMDKTQIKTEEYKKSSPNILAVDSNPETDNM